VSLSKTVDHVADRMSKGKKVVKRVEVEKAKGGYSASTHYHSGNGEYHEPEKSVHTNLASVKKHMASCFGETDE